MSDLDRLIAAFDAGDLCRPDATQPNFVDLVRAVATIAGVPDLSLSSNAREIAERIGEPEHLVFVLVDGLGTHAFADLPAGSWLREHLAGELQSVFPSTTGAAITSIATGAWPSEHAIVGWWTYLPQLRETACVLPFIRHRDGTPLLECGVTFSETFGAPRLLGRMSRATAVSQPTSIIDSDYSGWFGDGAATIPYRTPLDAAEANAADIEDSNRPTFTYWYTPAVDRAMHEHGAASDEARSAITEVDAGLEALADRLSGVNARIVLTADHGHRNTGTGFPIGPDDPLCAFLRVPPSGDMRTAFYHLQDGARLPFTHEFQDRFGDHFALISTQELDDLRLLGPDPLTSEVRRRVGDFTSLALDDSVMRYTGGSDGDHFMHQRSHHSGLSAAEMTIPLVLSPSPFGG